MAPQTSILTKHQRQVLELISREKYFTEKFYLAGGTALSEFYPAPCQNTPPLGVGMNGYQINPCSGV